MALPHDGATGLLRSAAMASSLSTFLDVYHGGRSTSPPAPSTAAVLRRAAELGAVNQHATVLAAVSTHGGRDVDIIARARQPIAEVLGSLGWLSGQGLVELGTTGRNITAAWTPHARSALATSSERCL